MSKRSLLTLLAVFAVLVALVGMARFWSSRQAPERKLWPGGDAAKVERLALSGPKGHLEFQKKEGRWLMASPVAYPANSSLVAGFLEKLPNAAMAGPLTASKAKESLFGLGPDSAVRVEVPGTPRLDFWAGKAGPDFESLYIRFGDSPEVFEAKGLSRYDLERSSADWLSKEILKVPVEEQQAVLVKSTWTLSLVRSAKGDWSIEGQKVAVSTQPGSPFNVIQGTLNHWEADQLMLPPFPSLGKPTLEIRVKKTSQGQTTETLLRAYPERDGMVPIALSGEERVRFLVYPWRLDAFKKAPAEFGKSS